MKNLFTLFAGIMLSLNAYSQEFRYEGILNDPVIDPDFGKGHEEISASIKENLAHLNLFEYAHALPELYPLVNSGLIKIEQWKAFIDSLEQEVLSHQNDTIRPYWAVDYVGLIPLQAQFFLATIHKNEKLNKEYPEAYRILVENTSSMIDLGYKPEEYDSLLVFSEVVGETNFWYFFQLEDCNLVTSLVEKEENLISRFKFETSSLDITSTFKVPYYLQKRKIQSLQRRLLENNDNRLCKIAAENINNRSIMIDDKNRTYFTEALRDGIDRNKTKVF